jgi:uncharacterized membrane protein (UPF0127 family)
MAVESTGYAFNRTRQCYLATDLRLAATHWSRFLGLMGRNARSFPAGKALWIVPSRGVHTFAMRFPIDVAYLNKDKVVIHIEEALKPWRVAPVRMATSSVLELPSETLRSTGTRIGDTLDITVGQGIGVAGS